MPTLRQAPPTAIITSADPGWDEACVAWNFAVEQRPAAIARPASAGDVVAAVAFARSSGLRIAAQGTGHGAATLGSLADTLLIRTGDMRRVCIDSHAMIARVEAGAEWRDVTEAAADHGLAALAGSAPDVGVAGYTMGGGIGWLGRAYGLAANNVEAFELVTADGRLLRADAADAVDLFWALRGGGGSFAIVTAAELRLFPISQVYAGLLLWPVEAAPQVLRTWRDVTERELPDDFSTAARMIRMPERAGLPDLPGGGSYVVIDVVHLGSSDEADRILTPLRALGPAIDTVQTAPIRALGDLHLDPQRPAPASGDGLMLASLPDAAIDQIIRLAGPGADTALNAVELRLIGGELRRARAGSGALAAIDADYALVCAGLTTDPVALRAVTADVRTLMSAMSGWAAAQMYLNLAESPRDPASFWPQEAYDRLRRIKAAVDPGNMIRSNHPIAPAGPQ